MRRTGLAAAALVLGACLAPGGVAAGESEAARPMSAEVARPLSVSEVAPGVFVHAAPVALADADNGGDIANLGFVVGADGVAVVDTGGTPAVGTRLRAAIAEHTDRPVLAVINTHMHPDHTFGNVAFRGSGPGGTDPAFIGHAALAPALAARAGHYAAITREAVGADLAGPEAIIVPDRPVEGTLALDLGGRVLELTAWPTAHTNNDLTVFDRRSGTLFAGDLVFMQHLPVVDGSITGWLDVATALAAIPATRVVPGHGPATASWPEALEAQQHYLNDIAATVRAAIAAGVPLAQAVGEAGPPGGIWSLVDTFHGRNLTAAYAELEWE